VIFINITGNTESLKRSVLDEIEQLHEFEVESGEFIPSLLASKLAELTGRINREICLFISRKGSITAICIGDSNTVSLPEVEGFRDRSRLAGVRCIHTHPNGEGRLSDVDINALLSLRLDAMAAIGTRNGTITEIFAALPCAPNSSDCCKAEIFGPFGPDDDRLDGLLKLIPERDKCIKDSMHSNIEDVERAILVGLETSPGAMVYGKSEAERSIDELEELALTAGVNVVHKIIQKRSSIDTAFYIGKGKTEELGLLRQALNVNMVIFDDELSGAQFRNIEEATGAKVIDRTTLILDIFAQRARSNEGKLQVELAQLKYRLPRLMGIGTQLSRLGGGIGTRGPGEKKLDVDRRHIRRRINFLESELKDLSKRRELMHESRKKNAMPTAALVGYTNAGKSTLMNKLCNSDVFVENKLFATLDPTTRGLRLPDGREMLLIDTVGFIRKLPHELIEAFKSTLEVAVNADMLVHVVDASSTEVERQVQVVDELLSSLGASNKPTLLVLNKVDLLEGITRPALKTGRDDLLEVSAATGEGMDRLLSGIVGILPTDEVEVDIVVPYAEGWVPSYVHGNGKILKEGFTENGFEIKAVIKKEKIERIKEYVV
jgi:GTP-binding protein HflX